MSYPQKFVNLTPPKYSHYDNNNNNKFNSLKNWSYDWGVSYGYLWWTRYIDANGNRYYGKLAQGNGGQKLYIFQELNLVVVITAGHYNMQSSSNELIGKYILPAFNKK